MKKGILVNITILFCYIAIIFSLNACNGLNGGVHLGYSKSNLPSSGKKVEKPGVK